MTEQFSTFDEIHQKIYSEIVLENKVHADYEWVLNTIQDVLFKLQAIKEVCVYDYIFSNAFHSVDFLRVLVLNEVDLTKSTFADHFLNGKVLKPYHALIFMFAGEE